jgi:hypothetical protein
MSFSLSARKLVVGWCSLVAIPVAVFSQNSFVTSGGEYSLSGQLAGDQVHPGVSFTTNGGYVVWEDYWMDGKGLGVGAMRLNNDLTGSGVAFKVNSIALGDQETAQVSALNDGGAAFVWQGGRRGFQHIYARFLSSSNTWLTGDVQVNTATNRFQTAPVTATLLNGNVAIVYASADQAGDGSMQDVYLQILAPSGAKVGGEILVNQFTVNNQRTPTIAALPNGRFVVGWVSEQERWTDASNGVPSVDIYARIFEATGTPVTSEILVNAGTQLCTAPDFAAAADNGFLATWIEKDSAVRNNGWDVYARRFTSAGVGVGGSATRVNTQLYGDQYSPKIRRVGTTYLDVWTSIGQDGSREGVFGRYLNDDATVSGSEFQVNVQTFGSQMHQALGSDGGRFLAAWTGFGVGQAGFDVHGQIYSDPALAVIGTNNSVFNTDPNANPNSVSNAQVIVLSLGDGGGDTGSDSNSVTLTLNDVKGTYNGLVFDGANVTAGNSGYITITITTSPKNTQGSFSAKLQMGGKKYSVSGAFNDSGAFSGKIGAYNLNLLVDLHGGDRITGEISDGKWTAALLANRVVFGTTKSTKLAGSYTMLIQPSDATTGNGIGTLTVDFGGNVKLSLVLPDGTKVSESTTLSKDGSWPLYAGPYKGGGVAIGWMKFGTLPADGFDGSAVWIKPAGASGVYPQGLASGVNVTGSFYKFPHAFGNSKLILNGGGLSAPMTNSVTWGLDNKISSTGGNALKLTVNPASGLFQGTVAVGTGKGATVSIQGVLFEKNNVGSGFFLGSDQSGTVSFAPNN